MADTMTYVKHKSYISRKFIINSRSRYVWVRARIALLCRIIRVNMAEAVGQRRRHLRSFRDRRDVLAELSDSELIRGYLLSQSPPDRKPRVRKPNLHSDRGQDSNPCAWKPLGSQGTHGSNAPQRHLIFDLCLANTPTTIGKFCNINIFHIRQSVSFIPYCTYTTHCFWLIFTIVTLLSMSLVG
ncbi:hypothetical protein E2C01_073482 [Portunus trituberculatus]|uniref:Uncharacterized protein n=1 Tax=Portunus trituberculatus TaxID=210409 RepID=A0A5B7I5H0_PORTR|nr:hypothetical protein [Portunus trituberculatus]